MLSPEDLPDEILERILSFATLRDMDGRTARTAYSVSRRWQQIISPVLYTHVGYEHIPENLCPGTKSAEASRWNSSLFKPWRFPSYTRHSVGTSPTVMGSASLFQVLEANRIRVNIQHLMIHDILMPSSIYQQLSHFSHTSLRTLTIWPAPHIDSRLSFFRNTNVCFPHLKRITFVGNIGRRENFKASRTAGPPRFPSLTNLHLVGSLLIPPFTHYDDVPRFSTVRYSHLTYDDASLVLRDMANGLRYFRDGFCGPEDFTLNLRHSHIFHAPPLAGTHTSAIQLFTQRVNAVEDLLKESWAQGFTFSVQENSNLRPHNRSPGEDNWDAVMHRLIEDESLGFQTQQH